MYCHGMGSGGMMDGMTNMMTGGTGSVGMMNGMMGEFGGLGMGIWGLLTMLVFWVAFILLIVWLVRTVVSAGARTGSGGAKAILDQRYARGELTRKEYDQMKKDIGS